MNEYDIIILGGGASGLSCAMELAPSQKRILILEKEVKTSNDRTWSFWEDEPGKYDHLLSSTWNKLNFYGNQTIASKPIAPYQYKMLRSSDFYAYVHEQLASYPNVTYVNDEVIHIDEQNDMVKITSKEANYHAPLILDGITMPEINAKEHYTVAQHFGGWFIETEKPCFDSDIATFMDFRIPQKNDTRFFYVLPISATVALVEIAIFSNELKEMEYYDQSIKEYIKDYLKIDHYQIKEKEKGVIPMTSYPFDSHNTSKIVRIGTAGGWVKPSSGYAFKRILTRSELLAQQIINGNHINVSSTPLYKWLDSTMLKAILNNYVTGKEVFDSLFKKRSFQDIFKFLDEENNFFENIKCMLSAPILPFTKAALTPKKN
ncbi:lycopene cyclase family protein [Portibacter lacus]|uniref:Lycopene cyclase n=1 Tax=Portibacter lacus TaxID=1099794 RepID=A0AA37SP68_9BACT|nr:lycopene cyclase family protein [Portibacter lacus]GLR15485.1 lycopene cyclase [Portibacter lacus]